MVTEGAWPPKSPRQALMSSPSGRRKYADYQAGLGPSPIKKSAATPSLLDRLRLARKNEDFIEEASTKWETGGQDDGSECEEDEETLRLQLAAIEAKLKLKKLRERAQKENSRPQVPSTTSEGRAVPGLLPAAKVEVALSPTRRTQKSIEARSPNRIALGIDKGMRATDVSLRRARSSAGSSAKDDNYTKNVGRSLLSRSSARSSAQQGRVQPGAGTKSFSERMEESRQQDTTLAEKQASKILSRSKPLKIDQRELDRYKQVAELQQPRPSDELLRDTGDHAQSKTENTTQTLTRDQEDSYDDPKEPDLVAERGNANLFEGFSGLHLSNRILPHSFLKRTLPDDQFTIFKVPDLLKVVTSPSFELPDEVGNFVVFGIIASKSQPLDHRTKLKEQSKSSGERRDKWEDGSQNRQKFMALTITDLTWTIDLFLFDTAVPRYHRLDIGTVVAILDPSIMPPKKGREDTGAFSLSLHNGEDTVLEIGKARDLGHCTAKKRDGAKCGTWVNASKTEICEWHLNAQVERARAQRMGVNTGGNGFGSNGPEGRRNMFDSRFRGRSGASNNGLLPVKEGRGFDKITGTHYYVSASRVGAGASSSAMPVSSERELSAARMLDLDVEDPFLAEGQISRDRQARLQKRMANQEKELDIADRLGSLGSGRGAGAEYMRSTIANNKRELEQAKGARHAGSARLSRLGGTDVDDKSLTKSRENKLSDLKAQIGQKRSAQDVQLSPVKKKTRFITSNGIREAGRASSGMNNTVTSRKTSGCDQDDDDDDDDDGLDII